MNAIIIMIAKFTGYILEKMGRGSSMPGEVALRLNKNILKYFKLPKEIVFVTGSNGKSTIAHTLTKIYREAGIKVGHNNRGSNITPGITTCIIKNSNIFGKSKVDRFVLEIDERYVKEVLKYVHASYFIITNISRDQPPRQGHFEFIYDEIKKGIQSDTHLILNGDDPLVHKFAIGHTGKVNYFELDRTSFSKEEADIKYYDNLDVVYCPICSSKLKYSFIHYGGVGSYKCPNNHFEKPNELYMSKLEDDYFTIDNNKIMMPNKFLYNIYNLSACYITAVLSGVDKDSVVKSLNDLRFKRIEDINYKGKSYHFLLSKNENAVSFNQSIDFVTKTTDSIVVIGFERISRRYLERDLSWLYDVDFEALKDKNIKIICTGTKFAHAIATRLKYAELDFEICADSSKLIDFLDNYKEKNVYTVFCFELEKQIKLDLKERL